METKNSKSDSKTKDGITVGLIDSIITIAAVLAKRGDLHDQNSAAVREAMNDLKSDENVSWLLTAKTVEMRLLDQKMVDLVVKAGETLRLNEKEATNG